MLNRVKKGRGAANLDEHLIIYLLILSLENIQHCNTFGDKFTN